MTAVRETKTRARLVEMETCKRRTNLETQRPAYASEPIAPQHHDPRRELKMCSPKRTNHGNAKGRQTQQDSNTCFERPMKKNLVNLSDGAEGQTSSKSTKKHTANSYHKSLQKGATERHDQRGHQQRSEHSRKKKKNHSALPADRTWGHSGE